MYRQDCWAYNVRFLMKALATKVCSFQKGFERDVPHHDLLEHQLFLGRRHHEPVCFQKQRTFFSMEYDDNDVYY